MSVSFLTPDEVALEYLTHLKGLKPEVNIDQTDSIWWVKSQVIGGVMSGLYADQILIADDAFPQTARREALERHLDLYFGTGFKQATQAIGSVSVTGSIGATVVLGTQFLYTPNGNVYQASDTITLTSATGEIPIISVAAGQDQDLLAGASLTISSPPVGINQGAIALTDFTDGRDLETDAEASQRVLDRVRFPIAGGTATDYRQWAIEADNSVVDANVIRYINGPGTVGVVLVAGTTDIDKAVNNGDPVIREPSDALVDKVAAYIDAKNPLTDCSHVLKPILKPVSVTVKVRFVDGDLSTIPAVQLTGQTLTQEELVIREVKRAIYKTPPGGRQFGSTGFVVASEIEELIDFNLSAEPYTQGEICQILVDRQVQDLSASGPNLTILATEIAEPNLIQVELF